MIKITSSNETRNLDLAIERIEKSIKQLKVTLEDIEIKAYEIGLEAMIKEQERHVIHLKELKQEIQQQWSILKNQDTTGKI